ncbi:hypothetical protein FUT89_26700, partial [Ralstonia pseudosolanacearum]
MLSTADIPFEVRHLPAHPHPNRGWHRRWPPGRRAKIGALLQTITKRTGEETSMRATSFARGVRPMLSLLVAAGAL